ncbi:MAG TPA: bis-aminopropyl spermidine synthase family protein [Actinomycetota bacterium]|nr:bis-aminopropyl spermidine synthase family protein [Actinomycetota bacterium]
MAGPGDPFEETQAAISLLRAELGIDFVLARRLIRALLDDSAVQSANTLVESTGIPYRRVLELLRALGIEAVNGLVEVAPDRRRALGAAVMDAPRADPPTQLRPSPDPMSVIEALAAGLPPAAGDLDHVAATPQTIMRRADYLRATYELAGARVVCLGDHDLMSVATALVAPAAAVSVVDIDERILRYLGVASDRLELGLRLHSGDLRLGLPRSLRGSADLVFADPPYTEEGIALFVDRGIEALAERPGARVVFCYGANDRGAGQLLAIQGLLHRRHLVLEAVLPGFNRYRGAHAIGATSTLWVCRPTRRTRPAVASERAARRAEGRIYSRGGASRQSGSPGLDPSVLQLVAGETGAGPVLTVGEGLELGPQATYQPLADLLDAATELPHPGAAHPAAPTVAVNLHPFYGDSLLRVLLAAPPECRLVIVAPRRSLAAINDERRRLVEARWRLGAPSTGDPAVLVAEPVAAGQLGPAASLLRYLQEHQAALLRNAWREGLVQLASRQASPITKNQARALIAATSMRPAELDAHLLELPADRLAHLVGEVEAVAGQLGLTPPPEGTEG